MILISMEMARSMILKSPTERIHGIPHRLTVPQPTRLENLKSVVENTPAGFVIGQFQADDADQDVLSFSVSEIILSSSRMELSVPPDHLITNWSPAYRLP